MTQDPYGLTIAAQAQGQHLTEPRRIDRSPIDIAPVTLLLRSSSGDFLSLPSCLGEADSNGLLAALDRAGPAALSALECACF